MLPPCSPQGILWSVSGAPTGTHYVTGFEFVDVPAATLNELHVNAGATLRFACNLTIDLTCTKLVVHSGGKLEIGPTALGSSIHITANRIEVEGVTGATPGGTFAVGTESQPAQGSVVITLTGTNTTDRTFEVGSGGTLELHGDSRGDTTCWTQLANNALANENSIFLTLLASFHWQPGDKIVLATTDFLKVDSKTGMGGTDVLAPHENEEFTVLTVIDNLLEIDPPLSHDHFGGWVAGGIDQRAEVGLLNRSIRIEGAPGSASGQALAGQVRFLQTAPDQTRIHIEWTEFTNLGRGPFGPLANQGRYPLHFHMMGSMAGSYVKNCSLHHNVRNGLVIHETDDLLVDNNVFYDTTGWHVWFQDDTTTGPVPHKFSKHNTLTNNLAILARHDRSIEHDRFDVGNGPYAEYGDAACFYLRSFDNTFRGNHAVGSQCTGIYVDTQEPWGDKGQWTSTHDFGVFDDNVSHSNGDHGFYLGGATEFPRGIPTQNPPFPTPRFRNFTAYKNNSFGFHCRNLGTCVWEGPGLSDNGAGVYLASLGYWIDEYEALGEIQGGVIRGDSENLGEPYPVRVPAHPKQGLARSAAYIRAHSLFPHIDNELTGVSMYDGLVSVKGTRFEGFGVPPPNGYPSPRAHSGAFGPAMYDNPWAVDPRNYVSGCTFDAVTRPLHEIFFRPYPPSPQPTPYPSGIHHTILSDATGCILGQPGVAYPLQNTNLVQIGAPFPHLQHGAMELLTTTTPPFDQPFAQVVLFDHDTSGRGSLIYGSGGNEVSEAQVIPRILLRWTNAIPPQPVWDNGITMHAWNVVLGTAVQQPHHVVSLPAVGSFPGYLTQSFTVLVTAGHAGGVVDLEIPYPNQNPQNLKPYADRDYGHNKTPAAVPYVAISSFDTTGATCFAYANNILFLRVVIPTTGNSSWGTLYGSNFTGIPTYVRF